jgi:hypothetical protein
MGHGVPRMVNATLAFMSSLDICESVTSFTRWRVMRRTPSGLIGSGVWWLDKIDILTARH